MFPEFLILSHNKIPYLLPVVVKPGGHISGMLDSWIQKQSTG